MNKEVLFLTPYNIFPPFWGGGIRTYNFIKNMVKDHKVHLISPSYHQFKEKTGNKHKKDLKNLGVDLNLVGPPTSWIQYINPFLLILALYKIIRHDIDLIICDYPWSGIYAMILSKLSDTSYILMEHNVELQVAKQTGYERVSLTKKLEEKTSKNAEEIVCVSEKDKKDIAKIYDIEEGKIHVLNNGFDSDKFNPECRNGKKVREELGVGDDPLIFFCGKLDYIPNSEAVGIIYHELVPRVTEKIPDAKFLIVGGGYDLSQKYENSSIIFTGAVDNIIDYLQASDLVITPIKKGGGTRIKILEAIACNKDIISTKKGVEELIDKHTKQFITIADDWKTFGQKIIENVNKDDPKAPEEFVEKYSWKNISKKLNQLIQQV